MIPKVVIVGRPNVGKSSLLNLIAQRMISIVDPTPGVTRDRISTFADLIDPDGGDSMAIELTDTGGHGIEDSQNLTLDVERQIAIGVADAHLILFIVDAQTGIVPLDKEVAKLLREAGAIPVGKKITGKRAVGKRVMLIANKVDGEKLEANAEEANQLGFGRPMPVSAKTKHNRSDFVRKLRETLMEIMEAAQELGQGDACMEDKPEPGMLMAIVGKRNAGKSTLVNALAGSQRVIVSEIEGTTRDSVDVRFEFGDKVFTAIDTAGVRKRKSLDGDIEFYSYHRSLRSIRRADVVLLLIDATVPVSQVDEQLAHEIEKHFKPCVIVVNKWDLVEKEHDQEEYIKYLEKHLKGFAYAPIAFISAKNEEGVREVVAMALNLHEQAAHRVPTGELNRVVENIIKAKPPSAKQGKRPKVYYVTQLDVNPPTIGLFVNDEDFFDSGYQRYLMNRFREVLPFSEVPIKLLIRGREAMGEAKA